MLKIFKANYFDLFIFVVKGPLNIKKLQIAIIAILKLQKVIKSYHLTENL
jgi:hypothetical protein